MPASVFGTCFAYLPGPPIALTGAEAGERRTNEPI
jgi:hypothetical protein